MNVYEKLLKVQTKLNAPKNRQNKFGGYSYRSCEDILEAVKPLLAEVKAIILLKDSVVQVGERYYVYAQAFFYDIEAKDGMNALVTADAYAREEDEKKGTSAAQLTGATSSYARKYALGALLLIDDQKDPDTDEYKIEQDAKAAKAKKSIPTKEQDASALDVYVTDSHIKTLEMLLKKSGISVEKFNSIYGLAVISELPLEKYDDAVHKLEEAAKAKKGE